MKVIGTTEEPPPQAIDMAELKRKSVRGGAVTMGAQAVSILIQLTSTVVLARLLSPEDYGIMAMVMAITAFAGLFRDLGLSAAAVQKGTLSQAQMSNLFWVNAGMGLLLTSLLAVGAPGVAWFYGKPELVPLMVVLSSTFFIGSLGTQHGALMQRELRFGRRALTGIVGGSASLVVSVLLAQAGHGYWALAWGSIVGSLITTTLLFALSPFRPGFWTSGVGVRSMLKFGANITAFDIVNYFQRNLDNILIGRFWGPDALGLYSRAYQLLMFPISNLRGPINTVAFPTLSRLQGQPAAFRAYYLKVTSLIAFLSMPLTTFFLVASEPIIELALGKRWLGVVPIFSALSIAAFIQPASGFVGSLLLSLGQGKRYLQCGLFNAVVLSLSFGIGVPWGPIGVAVAYAIGNYLIFYPWLFWAFRESPVSFKDFVGACKFPAIVALAAAVVGGACRPFFTHLHPLVQLIFLTSIFALAILFGLVATPAGRRYLGLLRGIAQQFRK